MSAPETPKLTVDCCVFEKETGRIVLIRRKNHPFKDLYALPGGFVDIGEKVEQACVRELHEETGLEIRESDLQLVGVFSDPERDPRGHNVSVAFRAFYPAGKVLRAGDDAVQTDLLNYSPDLKIAFDHHEIIQSALALKDDI